MGSLPPDADPTQVAEFKFQSQALAAEMSSLSVIAGTIAGAGVCPTTGSTVFSRETARSMFANMYTSGMTSFAGKWDFSVGFPAVRSSNGLLMVSVCGRC